MFRLEVDVPLEAASFKFYEKKLCDETRIVMLQCDEVAIPVSPRYKDDRRTEVR